jgi:hypothetical protein
MKDLKKSIIKKEKNENGKRKRNAGKRNACGMHTQLFHLFRKLRLQEAIHV